MGWLKAGHFNLLYFNQKVAEGWSSPNTALSFLMDTSWDSEDTVFSQRNTVINRHRSIEKNKFFLFTREKNPNIGCCKQDSQSVPSSTDSTCQFLRGHSLSTPFQPVTA